MIFDRDKLNEETDLNSILSSIALFEDLTDENIAVIAENVTRQTIERDEVLMRKADLDRIASFIQGKAHDIIF